MAQMHHPCNSLGFHKQIKLNQCFVSRFVEMFANEIMGSSKCWGIQVSGKGAKFCGFCIIILHISAPKTQNSFNLRSFRISGDAVHELHKFYGMKPVHHSAR